MGAVAQARQVALRNATRSRHAKQPDKMQQKDLHHTVQGECSTSADVEPQTPVGQKSALQVMAAGDCRFARLEKGRIWDPC
jgi:hypothetical protein